MFQAEDGIRDLVRSRGLGDVYKRQIVSGEGDDEIANSGSVVVDAGQPALRPDTARDGPVSYTHLTLPTSDLV